uniref:Ribosomal RNA-processing protein 43 n=1 Tax=Hirondellea gigas TaxID=1518452 RepID=A0A2P2I7C2_9CRUS
MATAPSTWKVIEPDSYYKSFLSKKQRPDGRGWNTARSITVRVGSVGTAEGSATVRLGNTTVVCGIKAEVCRPTLEQPNRGFVVPNVELYPCCSAQFKVGPPGEKAISTSQFLNGLLQSANIIDYTQLCPLPNKAAWCLYIDLVCVDYDGNLIDACVMAMIAALLHLSLPVLSYDEDTEALSLSEEHTEKLDIKERPLSTTFGIYDSQVQLMDPSCVDESECIGEVCVVLLQDGEVCSTRKTGGRQVSSAQVENFIALASKRLPELHESLEEALQQHAISVLSLS